MRHPGMLLALFALTLSATSSAHAGPRARLAEPLVLETSPNALPADPGAPPSALVEAALRLPSAQIAMQHLAAAGFTRAPQADMARVADGHVCVTLAYLDPLHPSRAPLVIVRSDPAGTALQTAVASAVFDVNIATGEVQLAPDVAEGIECMVTTTDMNSTRPDNYIVSTSDFHHSLMKWLQCAVLSCGAGGAACVVVGSVLGPLAPPAIGGCAVAVCAVGAYACMW